MNDQSSIKRCVTLFSFQEEYFLRKLNLEDCIATAARLDIPGIEIIGDQMIPGYPELSPAFIDQWHSWMDKYGRTPVCLDTFMDFNKYKSHRMSETEVLATVIKDIQNASKLGCTLIRMNHNITPEVMQKAVPSAERSGIRLALEIHAPHHLDHEFEQRHLEMMQRTQSPYLGFMVDLSIFTSRFPRVISERWVRNGMNPSIASYFVANYNAHNDLDYVCDEAVRMGARPEDIGMIYYGCTRNIYTDPRKMFDYMPWIFHIHANFNEMLSDGTEFSTPYDEIIPVLQQGGFKGYLSSEYEGNKHIEDAYEVDSVEQVRRHQVMLKRYLAVEQYEKVEMIARFH